MSEQEYELVMPFVTVVSKDGPHEDNSYAAGWAMGSLYAEVQQASLIGATFYRDVAEENVPQAELIAMRYGYLTDTAPSEVEGWVLMGFAQGAAL